VIEFCYLKSYNFFVIKSGGIEVVFSGRDLDVLSTALIIDIVANSTEPLMHYNIVSFTLYIILVYFSVFVCFITPYIINSMHPCTVK